MSTHIIHLQDKRRKSPYIIPLSYLEEIPADSRTCSTSMVNEPSGFEPQKFYCNNNNNNNKSKGHNFADIW